MRNVELYSFRGENSSGAKRFEAINTHTHTHTHTHTSTHKAHSMCIFFSKCVCVCVCVCVHMEGGWVLDALLRGMWICIMTGLR